jgi:hypothetical protein
MPEEDFQNFVQRYIIYARKGTEAALQVSLNLMIGVAYIPASPWAYATGVKRISFPQCRLRVGLYKKLPT